MADSTVKATSVDSNALYYEVSPTIIFALRGYNIIMVLMIIVAFVLCLVKGHENNTHYLLASNLIISSLISIVVVVLIAEFHCILHLTMLYALFQNWWYRQGDLSADKHWYIFLVATVIVFQCITAYVYVARVAPSSPKISTTPTRPPITWATINSSTLAPPTTGRSF